MKTVLAKRMYPKPSGTTYYAEDLDTEAKVEHLFDYCQIFEAAVFDAGWQFLMQRYGIDLLYEIDKKSGWHDAEEVEDYRLYLPVHLFDKLE